MPITNYLANPSLDGIPLRISANVPETRPKIQVSPGLKWITNEARQEVDAWLLDRFGTTANIFQVSNVALCHPAVFAAFMAQARQSDPFCYSGESMGYPCAENTEHPDDPSLELKDEYETEHQRFLADDGCCSCHLAPPCGWCVDEGNMHNLVEDPEAWRPKKC